MKKKFGLKDYCYFDNTDKPRGISEKEWDARKEKWDKLCLEECDDWSRNRYTHVIIEGKYPDVGLYDIEKLIYKEKHDAFSSPRYYAVSKHMDYKYQLRKKSKDADASTDIRTGMLH